MAIEMIKPIDLEAMPEAEALQHLATLAHWAEQLHASAGYHLASLVQRNEPALAEAIAQAQHRKKSARVLYTLANCLAEDITRQGDETLTLTVRH